MRVVETPTDAATIRRSDHHRHGPFTIRTVAHLGRFVHNLIKCGMDKIGELDFAYRPHSVKGCTDTHAYN